MPTDPRPLLYLDVDGPLNPFDANPSRRPEGYQTHRLHPPGWTGRKPLRVWLNPAHGPALLALPYRLVWATTWRDAANQCIGPLIGLPELEVVRFPAGAEDANPPFGPRTVAHWKLAHLVRHAAGRPFAWVDDEIQPLDHEAAGPAGPVLLHHVSARLGLLEGDLRALRAFATSVAVGR